MAARIGVTLAMLALVGCSTPRDPWAGAKVGQKRVLAGFTPLYCIASEVAGEHAKVMCLTTSVGPHDYAPTASDAMLAAGADLILLNGLGLDDTAGERLVKLGRSKKVVVELVGDALDHELLEHVHHDEPDPKDAKDAKGGHVHGPGGHHHHHGDHDPHVWLGLAQAKDLAKVVAQKLAKLDPEHKAAYEANAVALGKKLDELQKYGADQFKGVKSKAIVSQHESLRYFAKSFDLDLVDSIQIRPGIEADAGQLAKLLDLCKKKNVAAVAVEPQYSRAQAESLVKALAGRGLSVRLVEVDPMETAPPQVDGNPPVDHYLTQMRRNIDALAKVLR